MSKLVIVESPAKANTIKKYLGKDYDVVASKGHIRDLPAAKLSVDVKNGFAPKYALIKGKERLVKELQDKSPPATQSISQPTPTARGKRYRGIWRRCSALTSRARTESPSTK